MCTLFNILPGPPVGTPLSVRVPLKSKKGRARTLELRFSEGLGGSRKLRHTHTSFLKLSKVLSSLTDTHKLLQAIQHTVDVGFYAPAARTTPLCVFRVHTPLDQAI
jgi:hypothetical protein